MKNWGAYEKSIGDVGALTIGSALGVLIPALVTPLLTTLYSAQDFGRLGLITSILAVVSQVICLKYDVALTLNPSNTNELFCICIVSTIFNAMILGLAFFAGGAYFGISRKATLLTVAGSFFIGINLSLHSLAIANKGFAVAGSAAALRGISGVLVQVLLRNRGSFGLELGYIASYAVSSVYILSVNKGVIPRKPPSIKELKMAFKGYADFAKYTSFGSVSASMVATITNLFIINRYGSAVLGIYTILSRLIISPILLFGGCVGQVYGRSLAALYPNKEKSKAITISYEKALMLICMLMTVGAAVGFLLIRSHLNQEWLEVFSMLVPLFPLVAVRLIVVPLSSALLVWNRQREVMLWQVSMMIICFMFAVAAVNIGLGIKGFLWVQTLSLSLCYVWIYRQIKLTIGGS